MATLSEYWGRTTHGTEFTVFTVPWDAQRAFNANDWWPCERQGDQRECFNLPAIHAVLHDLPILPGRIPIRCKDPRGEWWPRSAFGMVFPSCPSLSSLQKDVMWAGEVETLTGSVETWLEITGYRSGLPPGGALALRTKRDLCEAQWEGSGWV